MRSILVVLGTFLSMSALASPTQRAVAFCEVNQELCRDVEELNPIRTRAGHFRFVGPSAEAEHVALAFLHRLIFGNDLPEVRSAIVPNCLTVFERDPELAHALFDVESESMVRTRIVSTLGRLSGPQGALLLEKAALDSSAEVREVTAALLGYRSDFDALRVTALGFVNDPSAEVRAFGVRAFGWHGQPEDFERLAPLLTDVSSRVRFQTVAALERLDDVRLRQSVMFQQLSEDSDPKVAGMVARILKSSNQ